MKGIKNVLLIVLTLFCAVAFGAVADTPKKKLCLAHLVGWGYDTVGAYDDWSANPHVLNPYPDKPLFPRGFENDPALGGGRRKQVETAVLYGIDGFVVDVVRMEACVGVMRAVYDAADGFDFKCVLCLDNFHKDGPDKLISVLANYARLFKSHPNSWIEDGRLVVFAYNLGMNAADWAKVEAALNADPATSIKMYARTVGEGGLRPSAGDRKMTQAVDGVYDFGCNGFTADEMKSRLREMRKMLDEKGGGLLCGGIAPGYMHYARGFYRPFLGTRSLRWSWEASLAADVDSVCLTTWNDYAESTQFEPSVANRATFLKINREYVRKWRGEAPPPRTPGACRGWRRRAGRTSASPTWRRVRRRL